jgi:iron complex outermembrane receptor protein
MTARVSLSAVLLATTILVSTPVLAQAPAPAGDNDEIIVTAQKREESLQNVPISIQALGTKKLDQLNISKLGPGNNCCLYARCRVGR